MKKEKKKIKVFYWIFLAFTAIIFFAFIELSKNTLFGWTLALAAFAGYVILEVKVLAGRKFLVRLGAWLGFFALLAAISFISAPPFKNVPAVDVKNPESTSVVSISQGDLTGVYNEDKTVEVYAGIPYAKPPVGELRWKEPQQPEKWSGVKKCDKFAARSAQPDNGEFYNTVAGIIGYNNFKISLNDNYREPMSEDSLYLNIWKPADADENTPVLVFIHGGSLTTGNTSFSEYRGEDLARRGIIVVNFAYRLGVFGYYANEDLAAESPNGTTGNYGLLDQIQALKWVKQNIYAFGGDPEKVTLAGESAGSSSVNALCVSPLAKGLFRYAIGESSGITPKTPFHTFRKYDDAIKTGKQIMAEMKCSDIADMRKLDTAALLKTQYANDSMTVDSYAITEQPYLTYEKKKNNEKALLNGFNSHEANVFNFFQKVDKADYSKAMNEMFGEYGKEVEALYPYNKIPLDYEYPVEAGGEAKGTYDAVLGAAWFAYSHYTWSNYVADEGLPVYEYYFTKDNRSLRANHAGEMPYAYGNLWRHTWLYEAGDYKLSDIMQSYWVNFVKTGNPNGEGLPEWKEFSENTEQVLELGEIGDIKMIANPYNDLYKVIDKYQNSTVK